MEIIHQRSLRIIELLADGEKSLTELAGKLSVTKTMALRMLTDLEKSGLIQSHIIKNNNGRLRQFKLKEFSLVISYDSKTASVLSFRADAPMDLSNPLIGQVSQAEFRRSVQTYLKAVELPSGESAVILFGSAARGNAGAKSDLDLLFLADKWDKPSTDRIRNALADAVINAGHQAISHFRTFGDFLNDNSSMARSIRKEGLIIQVHGQNQAENLWMAMQRYRNISL
jgi:predicted nucleotidyltransferase